MKFFLFFILLAMPFSVFSLCGDNRLKMEDVKTYFMPGSLKSNVFLTLNLVKKVRRCNTISGCEKWSEPKATIKFKDILNSMDEEYQVYDYPSRGDAYFKINQFGKISLLIDFWEADVTADVSFELGKIKAMVKSNGYKRTYGSYTPPVPYVSYYDESLDRTFDLQGEIGIDCLHLYSKFKVNKGGIIYDEYFISLKGE